MAWLVRLDFGDTTGWRDITDKVDKNSFRRTQNLWNELQPTIDTLRFDMLWDSTIVGLLLTQDSTDVSINVRSGDSVDYFTGYVRTNWDFSLKTRPASMKIECVDPGILLNEKRIEPGTPALWEDYTIYNAGDSAASIISKLMIGAGFTHADIVGDTVGDTIDFYPYVRHGRTYWEEITRLLFSFHRTPFFNASGKLDWVDWSPSSISIGDTFDNSNMVGELRLRKLPEKYQAVGVKYFSHKTITDALVFSDTTNGNQTHKCSITLAAGEYYPEGGDSRDVYADYRVEGENLIAVQNATVDKIVGDSVTEDDFTSYFTKALIRYHNAGASAEYIYKLDIRGDAVVQDSLNVKRRDFVSGTDRKLDYESDYIYTALPAERLARALASYYRYADFTYQLRSGDSVDLGTYVKVAESSWLNINNTAIVMGREDNEVTGEKTYRLEGMAAYAAGDTVTDDDGGVLNPFPKQSRNYIAVGASGYAGDADYYCNGTSDETEINTAITFAAANNIGTVYLVGGTFYIDGSIDMESGVDLALNGCTIERNAADYLIDMEGTSGTHITDVHIVGPGKLTLNGSDTNANQMVYAEYVDNGSVSKVDFNFNGVEATMVYIIDCINFTVEQCTFTNGNRAIQVAPGPDPDDTRNIDIRILNNRIYDVLNDGLQVYAGNALVHGNSISDAIKTGIVVDSSDRVVVSNNRIIDSNHFLDNLETYSTAIYIGSSADQTVVTGNLTTDNGTMIYDGDCEDASNAPRIDGNTLSNCTFAQSSAQAYRGSNSYLVTKTSAAGTSARVAFHDNENTTDQHGLNDAYTYRLGARIYIPSSGGPDASEVTLTISDYQGSWESTTGTAAATYDAWQLIEVERTMRASMTGILVRVVIASTAGNTEYIYIDDVRLTPVGLTTNGGDNNHFVDNGTDTVTYGNSWQ